MNYEWGYSCRKCGCAQFEKIWFSLFTWKNMFLAGITLMLWWVYLAFKIQIKGRPYRCVACKTWIPW